ncbi:MAG TPA: hypothetical protein DD490_28775 [Acidobacteria bacterium]|nr:hypothetical protein [Acidobacteriota bacterium]
MPLTVQAVTQAIPLLLKFPMGHFSVDYDKEADVLYISFRRPQRATDTQEVGEGVLLRYRGEELVGMTILEASTRAEGRTALPEAARTPVVPRRRSARRQP